MTEIRITARDWKAGGGRLLLSEDVSVATLAAIKKLIEERRGWA
jgi:hypothetical protein